MLPKEALTDPDVEPLTAISTRVEVMLVRFTNHQDTRSSDFKDYESSRASVTDLCEGGLGDVRNVIATEAWRSATEMAQGIHVCDLTPSNPARQQPPR